MKIVGVRFRGLGKTYYFDPAGFDVSLGDYVVVNTVRGIEIGEITLSCREIDEDQLGFPLKSLVRIANDEDIERMRENRDREENAFSVAVEKIEKHGLDMRLVDVEYSFDRDKLLFYFTADGRVDFRELVKDLAFEFKTRIELRQIGVRDESRMIGGVGICGREFCCSKFLTDFHPVSIKMAKEQGVSLNPVKISGACGRLMCCLKYEQDVYEELLKITPRVGAMVKTPDGVGSVLEVDLLRGRLKVSLRGEDDAGIGVYAREDITVISDGRAKN
jgi:cell fate regulator YaaT (PSP1 superfamily)